MTDRTLSGLRVAILATDGVEESELVQPRQALDDVGAKTTLISPKEEIQAFKHHDKSDSLKADLTLEQANPDDFDAVLLPGGALNADALRVEESAQKFVRAIDEADKPIAVICHAPWLLISSQLTDGRKMTSYHTIQDDVRNSGADWVDQEVVRDENWVSSRQPADIPAFNREMVSLFAEYQSSDRRAA
jgi:protease I